MEAAQARITEEISNFIITTRYENLSSEVQHIAKHCIIDGLGVILAGFAEPSTRMVRDYVLSVKGKKESTLLGKGNIKAPAHLAALVNGTAGHSMNWDDAALSNTPDRGVLLHPTIPPLVAGLAVGEKLGVSGRNLLTAFLVGFEVECKIAAAIHPDHWARGFHTSNTCGIFGATATAAKLMGLPQKEIRRAVGIAAGMAGGLHVHVGTMAMSLHVGRAAENGIVSAYLAALGVEAHLDALEGHKGFFHAFAGGFDQDKILGKLGQPFSIIDPGVSIKSYPCSFVGHPAMDAMRALVMHHDLKPEQVDYIKVATGSNVLGLLRYKEAQTVRQARFSLPFQMVSMIIRRKAGNMEFADAFVQSPPVQKMMGRVEAVLDPELDALGRHKAVSVIEVRRKDGKILRGKSSDHYRGGPQSPLSREELAEKFNDCVQRILDPNQGRKLLETIESLESLDYVGTLIDRAAVP
jgi:2-methylcitrate dehydratase PrpD